MKTAARLLSQKNLKRWTVCFPSKTVGSLSEKEKRREQKNMDIAEEKRRGEVTKDLANDVINAAKVLTRFPFYLLGRACMHRRWGDFPRSMHRFLANDLRETRLIRS